MTIAYWIVAGLLAVAFLGAGFMKVVTPKETLRTRGMGYVEDFSDAQIKLIGTAEVLGAIGLILPKLVGIVPVLSPIAPVVMAGAVVVHIRRDETFLPPLILGTLSVGAAVLGFLTLA